MRRIAESLRKGATTYEAKANVIEDSKGKASTSKGLKRKKTAEGTKARSKKARTCASRELATSTTKMGIRRMKCHSHPKKNKKDHPQANLTDHVSPSLSAVVSEMNLTIKNKDWWVDTRATAHLL